MSLFKPTNNIKDQKIAIIGGCGHVGLPLGVKFALAGAHTTLIDINESVVKRVMDGHFPFLEQGGDSQLQEALHNGLKATVDPSACSNANVIVFVIGTPVDEHLNPKLSDVLKIFDMYQQYFKPNALIIMRSTLFPGTMNYLLQRIADLNQDLRLAFCPERVSQGYALEEIDTLPQIISAFDDSSFEDAFQVFSHLAPSIIRLSPLEAEITKLMANSWRYLEFAIANQFYMIAEKNGVDFYRIYEAIRHEYPRAKGYKSPGFAAGPCLFKDTMQLASYFDHQFYLGHSAMLVNEGLANLTVEKAAAMFEGNLWGKTVGLLGMTFKANNDDIRESLSFRVKKGLEFHGAKILTHDPYLEDSTPLKTLQESSDVIILCTPHREYADLSFTCSIVDVWGFYRKSTLEIFPGKQKLAKE